MSELLRVRAHALVEHPTGPPSLVAGGPLCGTRYHVIAPLARGGMGELYAAWHLDRAEMQALKVLPSRLARNPLLRRRMVLEAEALRLVRHPRVVKLHAVGQLADGRPFLAMDLVVGESLRRRLDRQPTLKIPEAARWSMQLLEALHAVHSAGVAHGDVKPSNLVVDSSGDLTLVDFGAAEIGAVPATAPRGSYPAREPIGCSPATASTADLRPSAAVVEPAATRVELRRPGPGIRRCTSTGPSGLGGGEWTRSDIPDASARFPRVSSARVLIGTPKYMSPARKAGAAPSRESDLYAAGLVLQELAARVHAAGGTRARAWAARAAALARRASTPDGPNRFVTAAHMAHALGQLAGFFCCSRRWRSCFSRQTARRRSRRRRFRLRALEFCGMAVLIAQLGAQGKRLRPRPWAPMTPPPGQLGRRKGDSVRRRLLSLHWST